MGCTSRLRGHGGRLALALVLQALAVMAASAGDGVSFTERQAETGQVVYNDHCAECHRPDLTGALGPALVGPVFMRDWAGKPVSDLRNWIWTNMPPNAPGTLPDDQLDPIVALILMKNGAKPGHTPLSKANADGVFPKK